MAYTCKKTASTEAVFMIFSRSARSGAASVPDGCHPPLQFNVLGGFEGGGHP